MMNIKTKIMLLAAIACPITAFGAVDLSILEESKDDSGGSFVVQATPDAAVDIGSYVANLSLSSFTGFSGPIDITVEELVGAPFALSNLGGGLTLDAMGKQSVNDSDPIVVVALRGVGSDVTIGPASADLFRVTYEIPSFDDSDSFVVGFSGGVSPFPTAVGGSVPGLPGSSTTITGPTAVPEPSSFVLIGLVGLGLGLKRYYSKKSVVETA